MKQLTRQALCPVVMMTLAATSVSAKTVYYDNSVTQWSDVYAYTWSESEGDPSWPGAKANPVAGHDNLWSFDTECLHIIFNNKNNGEQTPDLKAAEFEVYKGAPGKGTVGTSYSTFESWTTGQQPVDPDDPDPVDPDDPSEVIVYYDNSLTNWTTPHVYCWGGDNGNMAWAGVPMNGPDADGLWYYNVAGYNNLLFTNGQTDNTQQTEDYVVTSGHVWQAAPGADKYAASEYSSVAAWKRGNSVTDPGAYQSYEIATDANGNPAVVITAEDRKLYLTPYNAYTLKVFALPEEVTTKERASISVCAAPASVTMRLVEDTEESLVFNIGKLYVTLNKSNCTLTFAEGDTGTVRLRENGGIDNCEGSRKITFQGMGDAAFYGGGYNGNYTNQNGRTLVMNNFQTGGWSAAEPKGSSHNICVPFIVSTDGYGLLFDDHYQNATITPSASNGTVYRTGSITPVAYYYVGGGDMESVMENYTFLTGRQQMPPYWALGYHTSRYGYESLEKGEEAIKGIRDMGAPLDGIVFDLYWQGQQYELGRLDWAPNDAFRDGPAWVKKMKEEKHVHTTVITEPFFTQESVSYPTLRDKGYLADEDVNEMDWLSSKVGLIDVTNPDAMSWMADFYEARTADGIDGHWMDLGEPEKHDNDGGTKHKGGTFEQVHNEFGNIWVEGAYTRLMEKFPGQRPFIMPRAGTSGIQRYSTFPWTGDIEHSWSGLQAQVPALVSAAMSGIGYLGSDVGGFTGSSNNDKDLYLRWIQFATFAPMMRTHAYVGDGLLPEPYHSVYSDYAKDIARFINLRYQYLPYTYTLAWENWSKGTPLARPVNMYDSNPDNLADVNDEYLWGRDLLIAPVLSDSKSRQVRFPEGRWIDMNNPDGSLVYEGTQTVSADIKTLPWFGRLGSIIPRFTQSSFTSTADIAHDAYTLDVLVDENETYETGTLFEDDYTTPSVSSDYAKRHMLTSFVSKATDRDITIAMWRTDGYSDDSRGYVDGFDALPEMQTYTFIVHNWKGATAVAESYNMRRSAGAAAVAEEDESAERCTTLDEFNASTASSAFYVDPQSNLAYIRATVPSRAHQEVVLSSSGVVTDVESVISGSDIRIQYAGEMLSYSLAEGFEDGEIAVYSADGTLVARFSGLEADGVAHQEALPLQAGAYVARITARSASGAAVSRNIKIIGR